MKLYLMFFVLLLLSCTKNKTFNFPQGKWEVFKFVANLGCKCKDQIDYGFSDDLPLCSKCDYYYYGYNPKNVTIEYSGTQKVVFGYEGKSETFKIKKVESTTNGTKTNFAVSLRNKKGKLFQFDYTLLNDTLMVGDFWLVGASYASSKAPNIMTITRKYKDNSGKLMEGAYSKEEILGIFKKLN